MPDRLRCVGTVLVNVVALNRRIRAEQRTPFEGVELTPNQLGLLFQLAHSSQPLTPGAAASALDITAGAVTQLVDALRAVDLVESVPNPDDRRSRILRLTDAARRRVIAYEEGVADRLMPDFEALTDRELGTLAALLDRIGERR